MIKMLVMDVDGTLTDGKIFVSDQITKSEMTGLTGVYINLRAAVVQSGGFEDAAAAWASLQGKGE